MNSRRSTALVIVALLIVVFLAGRLGHVPRGPLRAVLTSVDRCTKEELGQLRAGGANGVVLVIEASDAAFKESVRRAAERIQAHDLELHYWIEVARDATLAAAHEELAAGLQGHDNWRIEGPLAPRPAPDERMTVWPWVPILYAEAFDLQLAKVDERLADLPDPDSVFLNDLQGAPSACGCGNALCRWTVDFMGEAGSPLTPPPIAARFLERVRERHPKVRVVPVWTSECGAGAELPLDACHGIPCYTEHCWPALVEELGPVAAAGGAIGLQLLTQFPVTDEGKPGLRSTEEMDDSDFEPVVSALRSFPAEIEKRGLTIAPDHLIPILRCWEAGSMEAVRRQTEVAARLGIREWVVALVPVDQSWEPRAVRAEAR